MIEIPETVAGYYKSLNGVHRETMLEMRKRILRVAPDSIEIIKYAMPTFVSDGVEIAGLLANKNHVGYYPYSGQVLKRIPDQVAAYKTTTGALHVPLGEPLDEALIRRLIEVRRTIEEQR